MAIRRFEETNFIDSLKVDKKLGGGVPQRKADLPADVRARLDKANEYFDKIPPRANTPEEIAAFFAKF